MGKVPYNSTKGGDEKEKHRRKVYRKRFYVTEKVAELRAR